jgi:hypothetical protein
MVKSANERYGDLSPIIPPIKVYELKSLTVVLSSETPPAPPAGGFHRIEPLQLLGVAV